MNAQIGFDRWVCAVCDQEGFCREDIRHRHTKEEIKSWHERSKLAAEQRRWN